MAGFLKTVKHCLDFSFVFSAPSTSLKKPVFSKRDLLQWTVPANLYWDLLTSLSLFLKSEKIPALLYVGKGPQYRPFHDFRPVPSAYERQISVLRPFSYT